MGDHTLSLTELAETSGIEARTVRSYIERGLLPGAQNRGRGATYTADHLNRLRLIQALRRARPNITLSEIRIRLQQLTPQQISGIAAGSITATVLMDVTGENDAPEAAQAVGNAEPDATERDAGTRPDG